MELLVCYPFLDLRFLIEKVARPDWQSGRFDSVGSFGRVLRDTRYGDDAEIRVDAALAFGKEQQRREGAKAHEGKKRRFRQRKYGPVSLGSGLSVITRRLLADSDGHVRLELVLKDDQPATPETLRHRIEAALTSRIYVVREEGRPELINAGFNVARQYLRQSAKTALPSEAIVTQLVREGAGSPFVIVIHEGLPDGELDGMPIDNKPDMFAAVTCKIMKIAGRSTGVWQIWGAGPAKRWLEPIRMLCRIICQLSEVTLVTRLQQEPQAYAPYEMDSDRINQFFRVRKGQLNRDTQGPWYVASVQLLAAQHLKVAIDEALYSRENLNEFLRHDNAGTVEQTLSGIVEKIGATPMIQEVDRQRLEDLLKRKASEEDGFLDRLIDQSNVPDSFKQEWRELQTGEPSSDARRIIAWAVDKKTNPANPAKSTLASLLLPELGRLTLPDAALIVAMIATYRLIHDSDQLSELRIRYQTPISLPAGATATSIGPDIVWRGPQGLELQSWFGAEPPELDVGYLSKAVQHAASVCLVSVPISGETGTGVLIDERLALTNYHVVEAVLAAGLDVAQAALIELTFGKYGDGPSTVSITLDPERPILEWSPVDEFDYALLHLAEGQSDAMGPRAAKLSTDTPKLKAALSLLQHPKGGEMKLVPSDNAVTYVNPETGVIQYVARTSKGSSGAPCFDDQWRVAAIHHAERSLSFSTIREGILIGPIRERIKTYLN